jgi:hypothetical protein
MWLPTDDLETPKLRKLVDLSFTYGSMDSPVLTLAATDEDTMSKPPLPAVCDTLAGSISPLRPTLGPNIIGNGNGIESGIGETAKWVNDNAPLLTLV